MSGAGPGGQPAERGRWDDLLRDDEREIVARAGFGRRTGFGAELAVVVVDAQNFMVGPPPGSPHAYPSACGAPAVAAVARTAALLAAARDAGALVVQTRLEFRRDGSDIGAYGRKRPLLGTEGWCLEGSEGAELVPQVGPAPSDVVLVKKRPSAFFGTPLASLLVARGVDTVVVCGGSTSNCVRATVVDAMSHGYRVIVPEECVFDRFEISHRATLFDLDRQYADVVDADAVIRRLAAGRAKPSPPAP